MDGVDSRCSACPHEEEESDGLSDECKRRVESWKRVLETFCQRFVWWFSLFVAM